MSDEILVGDMVGGATDTGLQRRENQDRFWVSLPPNIEDSRLAAKGALFAVADGMGGEAGGQQASERTIQILVEHFYADAELDVEQSLGEAIAAANQAVTAEAQAVPHLKGMGSTLTAAVIRAGELHLAHVGDSRAYLLRPGAVPRQLTTDHTWVQEQVTQGTLTPEEAARHPNRSMITRAIGGAASVEPEWRLERLQPGDWLLLCSDGLTNVVTDAELMQAVDAFPPQQASQHLVDLANQRGGPDNITVVVVKMPGEADAAFHAQETMPVDSRGFPVQRDIPTEATPAVAKPAGRPPRRAPYLLAVAALVALALIALMVFLKKGVDEPLAAARATDEAAAVALAEATGEKETLMRAQTATAAAGARQTVEAAATAGTATAKAEAATTTADAASKQAGQSSTPGASTNLPATSPWAPAGAIIQRKPVEGATVGCVQFEWDVPEPFEDRKEIVYKILVCDAREGGNSCVPQAVVKSPQGFSEVWDPGKSEELNILGHNFSGKKGLYRWKVEAQGQAPLPGESQVWSFTWNGGRCGEPTRVRNDEGTDDEDPAPHATEGSEGY